MIPQNAHSQDVLLLDADSESELTFKRVRRRLSVEKSPLLNNQAIYFHSKVMSAQGRSQPHSPGWARVPLSSFFPQILIIFSYFSSNFSNFLPHFGSPGGRVAHPGRPWLRHCVCISYVMAREGTIRANTIVGTLVFSKFNLLLKTVKSLQICYLLKHSSIIIVTKHPSPTLQCWVKW